MFAVLIVHFYDYRKQETFQTMSIFKANISVLLIIIIILKSKKWRSRSQKLVMGLFLGRVLFSSFSFTGQVTVCYMYKKVSQ